MIQFLVRYRRSTGDLLQFEELGSDRDAAMKRRLEEEKSYKDDSDVEVVLLTASSREALLRTHARYFKSVSELAAALGAALPEIPPNGSTRRSKVALNIDEPKN
jgi:hypothetical protein